VSAPDPDDVPSSKPDADKEPDLRFTSFAKRGVSVDRDLSGQGHLARGSRTNMSNLRFSIKAQAREELDPELQQLRMASGLSPSDAAKPRASAEAVQQKVEVPPVIEAVPAPPSAPSADGKASGFFAAIKRLFS
jgi:hypothetical protein